MVLGKRKSGNISDIIYEKFRYRLINKTMAREDYDIVYDFIRAPLNMTTLTIRIWL